MYHTHFGLSNQLHAPVNCDDCWSSTLTRFCERSSPSWSDTLRFSLVLFVNWSCVSSMRIRQQGSFSVKERRGIQCPRIRQGSTPTQQSEKEKERGEEREREKRTGKKERWNYASLSISTSTVRYMFMLFILFFFVSSIGYRLSMLIVTDRCCE